MKIFEELEAIWPEEERETYQKLLAENDILFKTMKDEYQYLQEIIQEFDKDEVKSELSRGGMWLFVHNRFSELIILKGWNVEKEGKYRILYKKIPETPMISIRMEVEVDVPLINMITLINEIELWNLWVPFIKKSHEVSLG